MTMAGFLYYLPQPLTKEAFQQSRSNVFDAGLVARGVEAGPDGKAGLIVARSGENAPRIGYWADRQHWQKVPTANWWLGWENGAQPAPADLIRAETFPGHEIELEDGNDWTIPVVRLLTGDSAMPQGLGLGPDGKVIQRALARYEKITAVAQAIWESLEQQAGAQEPGIDVEWDYGIAALAMNYHVGPEEVDALRLLSTPNLGKILLALIDWPTFLELYKEASQKKTAGPSASSNIGSGAPDSDQVIAPPSPILNSSSEDSDHAR